MNNVRALVIGISQYELPGWSQKGPARGAFAVLQWLLANAVPKSNIDLFLSPEDLETVDRESIRNLGIEPKRTDFATINRFWRQQLPQAATGDLRLFVFWCGHGITDRLGRRLFFCSDYSEHLQTSVFNATEFCAHLRARPYAAFKEQLILADVCGTYADIPTSPTDSTPTPADARTQLTVFASPDGAYTTDTDNFGMFTRALLATLEGFNSTWPDEVRFLSKLNQVVKAWNDKPFRVSWRGAGEQRAEFVVGKHSKLFDWPPADDPGRAPYRGMRPLEFEDAGIFFGRDGDIVGALDQLRGLCEAGQPRLLIILGASGAGKSSFLRAGLLPRLTRDSHRFISLPIVRPERGAITGESGLIASLTRVLAAKGIAHTRGDVRQAVMGGTKTLRPMLAELISHSTPLGLDASTLAPPIPPTLILPIDQGEELFTAEGAEEAAHLLILLRDLVTEDAPAFIAVFTIRSDAYERLQLAKPLEGLRQATLSLAPIPRGTYSEVIVGPVRRLEDTPRKLALDERLTQRILADIEAGDAKDALALLAFTLERLYVEFGGDGNLTLGEYERLGGITGAIEAAVERAFKVADGDARIPRDRTARLSLLRRGLIPWLAGIDPQTRAPRRRVARLVEIPAEARPLIDHLVEQRLLATDVAKDTGETTIEPAHEALLRQWGLLAGWLAEDSGALAALEGVKRAASEWSANGERAAWLAHSGTRLEEAEQTTDREAFAGFLDTTEKHYLAAARAADMARGRRERWLNGAVRLAAVLALIGAAYVNSLYQTAYTERYTALTNESRLLTNMATELMQKGNATDGILVALEGLPDDRSGRQRPIVASNALAVYRGLSLPREISAIRDLDAYHDRVRVVGGRVFLGTTETGALQARDLTTGRQIWTKERVGSKFVVSGDARVIVASLWERKGANVYDGLTGELLHTLAKDWDVSVLAIDSSGRRVLFVGLDGAASVWDLQADRRVAELKGYNGKDEVAPAAAFSPDGTYLALGEGQGAGGIWRTADGERVAKLAGTHTRSIEDISFSPDGQRLLTTAGLSRHGGDDFAKIWTIGGAHVTDLSLDAPATYGAWSPAGEHVAIIFKNGKIGIWRVYDPETRQHKKEFDKPIVADGHTQSVYTLDFRADGKRFVTASWDQTTRIWDSNSGQQISLLAGHAGGHKSAAFTATGEHVVTASADRTVLVWSLIPELSIAGYKPEKTVMSAVFSPDGRKVAVGFAEGRAQIVDVITGRPTHSFDADTSEALTASFHGDGRWLAINGRTNGMRLWSTIDAQPIEEIGPDEQMSATAISRSGKWAARNVAVDVVRISLRRGGNSPRRDVVFDVQLPEAVGRAMFNALDDRVLLTGREVHYLYEIADLGVRRVGQIPTSAGMRAHFSGDGTRIVVEGSGNLDILDARTGDKLRSIVVEDNYNVVDMTADGRGALIMSRNYGTERNRPWDWYHKVRVVDLTSGLDIFSLKRQAIIGHAAISADGRRLVLSGASVVDGFEVATRKLLFHRIVDEGTQFMAIDPNGSRVLLAYDGKFEIWTPFKTTQELIDRAKKAVGRCLSQQQRQDMGLSLIPPRWCITGVGSESASPVAWRGIPPYDTQEWRNRLAGSGSASRP